jgi:hypothetical protein
MAIGEVKSFSASDFRGFGADEQVSTFLVLPAFVAVLVFSVSFAEAIF